LVANDGHLPQTGTTPGKPEVLSPRKRGVRKGLFFFLLSFLILPIIMMITIASNSEPYILFVAAVIFIVGGLLRMAYALMFEEGDAAAAGHPAITGHNQPIQSTEPTALPDGTAVPATLYAAPPGTGMWLDTNDLQKTPHSVTDSTTKLLERDQ
jgi:hypothetical protein